MQQLVKVHTHGIATNKHSGWGYALRIGIDLIERAGSAPGTTPNRACLTAAVESLKLLKEYVGRSFRVELTASEYVTDGMGWMAKWAARGWKTPTNTTPTNVDLWQELYELALPHEVVLVKPTAWDPDAERAEQLAGYMAVGGGSGGVQFYLPTPVRGGLKGILAAKAALEARLPQAKEKL